MLLILHVLLCDDNDIILTPFFLQLKQSTLFLGVPWALKAVDMGLSSMQTFDICIQSNNHDYKEQYIGGWFKKQDTK